MKLLGISTVLLCAAWTTSFAQTWEHGYLEAENAEQLNLCYAGVLYSDGPFLTRIYDDTMDFYLADDSFSMPPDESLGNVIFSFGKGNYLLEAVSSGPTLANGNASGLYMHPEKAEFSDILSQLRFASQLDIVFPDSTTFTIDLDGSNEALTEAFRCWSNNETGSGGINPFSGNSEGSRNPFEN